MAEALTTARRFAIVLDSEDYDAAAQSLSEDCSYRATTGVHIGAAAIIASYREAGARASRTFEAVRYESSVRSESELCAVVTFTDHLQHNGHAFTYSCEQRLQFGDDGKIPRITHVELPGQREGLHRFFTESGVSRG